MKSRITTQYINSTTNRHWRSVGSTISRKRLGHRKQHKVECKRKPSNEVLESATTIMIKGVWPVIGRGDKYFVENKSAFCAFSIFPAGFVFVASMLRPSVGRFSANYICCCLFRFGVCNEKMEQITDSCIYDELWGKIGIEKEMAHVRLCVANNNQINTKKISE